MTDPKITLGGVEYEIPRLAIKQNRHVEPLAAKHGDYFLSVLKNDGKLKLLDLTEEQALDFTRIVYHALTRAKPELSFAEFEQWTLSMKEIMEALPVCLHQSGLFKPAKEAAPPTGEAQAPSTGTA